LAEARGEDARSLQLEIDLLKEQLASRTKALFGDSSERRCNGEHQDNEERKEPRGDPREATLRAVRNPGTVTLARDLKSSES
jgi:hypothetical protein